ncbi:MAG: phosphotransferase, partial [Candidatus Aenigmarchaeota archaeon]|nr:phosphotransferase [Candidatus Aenigmarchaeota archaeon]
NLYRWINEGRGPYEAVLLEHYWKTPYRITGSDGKSRQVKDSKEAIDYLGRCGISIVNAHNHTLSDHFTDDSSGISELVSRGKPIIYSPHIFIAYNAVSDPKAAMFTPQGARKSALKEAFVQKKLAGLRAFKAQSQMMEVADRTVYINHFMKDLGNAIYPSARAKGTIIPLATDFMKYSSNGNIDEGAKTLRSQMGDGMVIAYSGRCTEAKGIFDLAEGFNRIKSKHPSTKLLLVGPAADDEKSSILASISPGYRQDVFFTGYLSDKGQIAMCYKAADMVVIPSYYETFSMAGIEVLSVAKDGKPALAISDVDGPHEIFVSTGLGYGVKPGNPESIRQAFEHVASHPKEAKERTIRAHGYVTRKYSPGRFVEDYEELFDQHTRSPGLRVPENPIDRLVNKALGRDAKVISRKKLSGGMISDVFEVAIADGGGQRNLIVKLYGDTPYSEEYPREASKEEYVFGLARKHTSVPVPNVILVDDSSIVGKPAIVTDSINGTDMKKAFPGMAYAQITSVMKELGKYMADLHTLKSPEYGWIASRREVRKTTGSWAEFFAGLVEDHINVDAGNSRLLSQAEIDGARKAVDRHWKILDGETEPVLIHNDIWPQNILIDSKGSIGGIIDAEMAMLGPRSYDIFMVNYWARPSVPRAAEEFMSSYYNGKKPVTKWDSKLEGIYKMERLMRLGFRGKKHPDVANTIARLM